MPIVSFVIFNFSFSYKKIRNKKLKKINTSENFSNNENTNGIKSKKLPEIFWLVTTAYNMSEYGFSLTRIFPYNDKIVENAEERKPVLWHTPWNYYNRE